MTPAEFALFAAAGFATGVFSGALGVGGALLATPVIRFLGLPPYLAVGTTVPVILPTTLTGTWIYRREGLVDVPAALWTAGPAAAAVVLGALATRWFDGRYLMIATAGILAVMAFRMLGKEGEDDLTERRAAPWALGGVGAVAGLFSGLLGIGGGFLLVPAYVRVFRFGVKRALGTSLFVITLIVLPNIVTQAWVGNIDWGVAVALALGVVPGARVGARLSIRARERNLRRALVAVLLTVAIFYALGELVSLWRA